MSKSKGIRSVIGLAGRPEPKGKHLPSPVPTLTEEMLAALVASLKSNPFAKWAVGELGYGERVFYEWLERGEAEIGRMSGTGAMKPKQGEAIYVRLVREHYKVRAASMKVHAINAQRGALGQAAQYHTDKDGNVLRDAAGNPVLAQPAIPPDPKLSLEWLARVAHNEFGRKIRQELTTPEDGGGPTELRITVVKKRRVKKREEV